MADVNKTIQCFACTPYKYHKDLLHLSHISYLEQADIWMWNSHMFRSISKECAYSVNISKDLSLAQAGVSCDITFLLGSTNKPRKTLILNLPTGVINGRTFFKMCILEALNPKVPRCFIYLIHMCKRSIYIRRALAISMALHPRLGEAAAISSLPFEMLFAIVTRGRHDMRW